MKPVFVIGIGGGTGSGKTMVAQRILDGVGANYVVLLHQDAYYKDRSHIPTKERHKLNFDHPEAFDNQMLVEHLNLLKSRKPVPKPVYNFSQHMRLSEPEIIEPKDVVILEGLIPFVLDVKRNTNQVKQRNLVNKSVVYADTKLIPL